MKKMRKHGTFASALAMALFSMGYGASHDPLNTVGYCIALASLVWHLYGSEDKEIAQ